MDIEQMRIRMGEMAAEIERLQSVIDEANAQPSCAECGNGDQGLALYCVKCIDNIQQSPGLNFTVMQALATLKTEVLGLESPVYAIQLIERIEAEQQSPAVAVPDGLRELIAACRQIGFPVVTEGMRYVIDDMQSALSRVQNSIGATSPRIAEQDANHDYQLRLEVYEKARDYVESYEKSTGYPPSVDLMFQNFNALCNLIHTYRVTEQEFSLLASIAKSPSWSDIKIPSNIESSDQFYEWLHSQRNPLRVTEQDAREIGLSAFRHMSQYGGRTLETWLEEAGRALLDKLNGKPESVGGWYDGSDTILEF